MARMDVEVHLGDESFLNTVAGGGTLPVLPVLTFTGMDLAVAKGNNWVRYVLTVVVIVSAAKMIMDALQ